MELNWDKELLQIITGFSRYLYQQILPLKPSYIQKSRALAMDFIILQMKIEHLKIDIQWLIKNPYSNDKCSSPVVQMMKGLKIPDPNLDKDIPGVATVLNSESKIKVLDSSNPFNVETIQSNIQGMAKGSSLVAEVVSHTTKRLKIIEIIVAPKENEITIDQIISLKLKDADR